MVIRITIYPHEIIAPVPKLMPDLGFDEIRAILDPLGQKIFELIGDANKRAAMRNRSSVKYPKFPGSRDFREFPDKVFRYVRCHNMFTGNGGDRQGAKNAGLVKVTYDKSGLHCDFDMLDAAYQTFIDAGCIPFVELGFTPPALAQNAKEANEFPQPDARDAITGFDPKTDIEEDPRGICSCPPRSFTLWGELVRKTVLHLKDKFGDKIKDWLFELWNEPDLMNFWSGSLDEYCQVFEKTARMIKGIDPELRIGGPSIARSTDFLQKFLEYMASHDVPIDFISGHVKGGSPGLFQYPNVDVMIFNMHGYAETIGKVPRFNEKNENNPGIPFLLNEADPFLACVNGIMDNPVYAFRETTYYPCFVARYFRYLLNYLRDDVAEKQPWFHLYGVYSDNLHMIDERVPFGGYRCTTTVVPVDRSLLQHPEVIVPSKVFSGALSIPEGAKRWNKYAHLVDRERLFSVHPIHPAWNEPFIVVKKPIFHAYETFQLLGPDEIKADIDYGDGTKLQGDMFGVISTISRGTKEVIVLLYYLEEDPYKNIKPIEVRLASPQKMASGENEAFFKVARCILLSPQTCSAFSRWKEEWSKLDALNEAGVKALLEYNRLPMVEEHVDVEGETIWVKKTVEMNSVITWILKYD